MKPLFQVEGQDALSRQPPGQTPAKPEQGARNGDRAFGVILGPTGLAFSAESANHLSSSRSLRSNGSSYQTQPLTQAPPSTNSILALSSKVTSRFRRTWRASPRGSPSLPRIGFSHLEPPCPRPPRKLARFGACGLSAFARNPVLIRKVLLDQGIVPKRCACRFRRGRDAAETCPPFPSGGYARGNRDPQLTKLGIGQIIHNALWSSLHGLEKAT